MRPLRLIAALSVAAFLGACADNYLAVDGDGHHTATAPKPTLTEGTPPAPVIPIKADTCGAASLQYLIGKPKSEVPVPVDMSKRRVYCSTCMVTMDYRPDRLNIVFDQDTSAVTAVKCG